MAQDVLVTGGAGFIGSWFCTALLRSDAQARVICLDNLTYCTSLKTVALLSSEFGERFVLVRGDIAEATSWRELSRFPDISRIVHFAAESSVDRSFERPDEFVRANIVGTTNLLEFTRERRVARLLHISTDEVYGEAPDCAEDAALGPTNPYAATKAAAEMLVHAYYKSWRLPIVTVRCSNVYGPRQYPEKIVPRFCKALAASPPQPCVLQGNGYNRRRYLYVTDAVEAMLMLLDTASSGCVYNVGPSQAHELENREVLKLLLEVAQLDDRMDLVKYGTDRLYNDAQYSMDCSLVQRLGWIPQITLREGLRACFEWEQQNPGWFESGIMN